MTELKLGKDVHFYNFSRGTLANILPQLLISHSLTVVRLRPRTRNLLINFYADSVTCLDTIPSSRRVGRAAFSDFGYDLATSTQRVAPHCLGPASEEWADPTEETAEKIAEPAFSLKV